MVRYALDRVITAIPLLIFIAFGVFLLVHFMPGDAAVTVAGEGASAEQIEAVRDDLGLNLPIYTQFWNWVMGIIAGDFGTSYSYNVPVSYLIIQRLEVTFSLVAWGLLISTVAGVVIGGVASLRGGWFDKAATIVLSVGLAVPTYWIAIILIIVFALTWRLFAATGYVPIGQDPVGWARSLVLPVAAIAVTSIADVARQVRSTVSDVEGQEYIRTARAMGVRPRNIIITHIGRNSGIPIVTVSGLQVERLIGATIVIEGLFALPGFGTLMLNAVLRQDLPVIQATVLLVGAVVICVNTLVDISYSWISPRVRN